MPIVCEKISLAQVCVVAAIQAKWRQMPMVEQGLAPLAFSFILVKGSVMKPFCQIVDDTKGKNEPVQTGIANAAIWMAEEEPELMIEKIQQQATHLGPVLEEILRQTPGCGQDRWD